MASGNRHGVGVGPLTARRVINDALGMLRHSFARICVAALVFFALPALMSVLAAAAVDALPAADASASFATLIAYAAVVVAVSLRVLGPVAFAGFLDEAVAKEYLHGTRHSLGEVLSELPWRRLIVADVVVVVAVAIGAALFVLPGLVAFGALGLVGPVIVQERDGVSNSLRRTIRLARAAPLLVAGLVVTPFAFEQVVHEVVLHSLEANGLGVQVIAEWLLAVVLGGTVGLLEVALATELMARNPRTPAANGTATPLLDDGQAPAV
jgi:hypothetical protein